MSVAAKERGFLVRVAIRGCGNSGKKLKSIIDVYFKSDVVACFIDANPNLWGDTFQSVPVVSPYKARTLYREENGFDSLLIPATIGSEGINRIIDKAIEAGIMAEDIYVAPIEAIHEKTLEIYKQWDEVSQIRYVEYHICDYCNLNCKGCAHFSPISPKKMAVYDNIEKDLKRMKEVVSHIEVIRILGGEPLLNPEVDRYMMITRMLYKYSEIRLVTNGLLLLRQPDRVIKAIVENNINVDISLYPPLYGEIDRIVCFLKERKIDYRIIMGDNDCFFSSLNLSSKDNYKMKKKVCPHKCVNLRNGKITACHMLAYVDIFNRYFDCDLPMLGSIDIYNLKINAVSIREAVMQPIPLCRYCDFSREYKWERSGGQPQIEDWLA